MDIKNKLLGDYFNLP